MLNVRHTRFLLYVLTAGCLLGAAAAVVWALSSPPQAVQPEGTLSAARASDSGRETPTASIPPLESFRGAWRLDLHRPLHDPPPPPKPEPPAPPPPPPLKLRLLGTAVEPGRAEALLLDSAGRIVCVQVGQTVDGATLQRIEVGQVEVRYHDHTQTLTVPSQ